MGKCMYGCGRNTSRYGKMSFNLSGYKFKITKLGSPCEQCAKEKFLKNFETYREKLIKELYTATTNDKKGIIVDWNFYRGLHNDNKPQLNEILIALGILDYKSKGNWEIFGNRMILNPHSLEGVLYFTRRKDVLGFAKTNYGEARYFCEIRKISKIMKL